MREIFLDTETTGLSFKDGHKIVEIACIETKDLLTSLVDLCLYYDIPITEEQLLTVCGKCGGYIIALDDTSQAPEHTVWPGDRDRIPEDVPVLICEQCSQLYW